jgi:heat shock protein HtpX
MFWNNLKTVFLLVLLSSLLMFLGTVIGGTSGLTIAFSIALLMNFGMYFYSDKLVLKMYKAKPLDRSTHGKIYDMVEEMCGNARMPMPKLWIVDSGIANAFATGRNPKNASVAITSGIVDVLDDHELRGVLAHELSHVKNRDILVATIAAVMATTIGYVADMLYWSALFGGRSRDDEGGGGGFAGAFLISMIMPFAAVLIQLAISRSREFLADETGGKISRDPLALASALEKLHHASRVHRVAPVSKAQATTASLFIVNPFSGGWLTSLFSTHPAMEKRIQKLRKQAL